MNITIILRFLFVMNKFNEMERRREKLRIEKLREEVEGKRRGGGGGGGRVRGNYQI